MVPELTSVVLVVVPMVILMFVFYASLKILREYERGVVFALGRFWMVKGPGLIVLIPFVQQMERVDLRTRVLDVPSQHVISPHNLSSNEHTLIYYRALH